MQTKPRSGIAAAALAACVATGLGASQARAQEPWEWSAAFYLWAAGITTETESGATAEISFGSLLENLNSGAMASLAARRDKLTLFGDFIYLNVNGSEDGTVNFSFGPSVDAEIDVRLASFISTIGAAYEVAGDAGYGVSALGGLRYIWLESEFDASLGRARGGADGEDTSWDAVVGLRGNVDFNETWYLTYYADVGAGQSDLTWQALASVNYRFDAVDLAIGYRYTEWQFRDFGSFQRLDVGGPFAGVRFRF